MVTRYEPKIQCLVRAHSFQIERHSRFGQILSDARIEMSDPWRTWYTRGGCSRVGKHRFSPAQSQNISRQTKACQLLPVATPAAAASAVTSQRESSNYLPAMAGPVPERRFYHWITDESVLLCQCYCHVSNEEGGPGTSQDGAFFWEKICAQYHSRNPPIITGRNGQANPPRDKQSMINKWGRMGGFFSEWIRSMAFALANHKSGESEEDDFDRASELYVKKKGCKFAFLKEYEVLKVNHKWMINNAGTDEQATGRAGTAHATPLRARLEMVAEAAPTCANTKKPLGVKKARMIKQGLAAADKEIESEERHLSAWAENFAGRKETSLAAIKAAADRTAANAARTDALLSAQDDSMLLRDTSRMSEPVLAVFLVRQKLAMDRILHRCLVADRVMAAAATAAATEFAAAAAAETVPLATSFAAAAETVETASGVVSPPRDDSGNGGDSDTEEIICL